MATPDFDLDKAHRWFAIECNNAAWDIIEKPGELSSGEADAMLHQAHASFVHWAHAGDELNHMRAYVLLATAYGRAGRGADALHFAETAVEASEALADTQNPFDKATAYGAKANALASAGHTAEAAEWRKKALDAAAILDPEERKAFEQLYADSVNT